MRVTKEQGINISSSVIVSWITIGMFLWLVAKPLLLSSVSAAMADDIKQTVADQVEPLNNAFVALLQRDINTIRKEIAGLRYKERQANEDWSSVDAQTLTDREIELEALQEAKAALQKTP